MNYVERLVLGYTKFSLLSGVAQNRVETTSYILKKRSDVQVLRPSSIGKEQRSESKRKEKEKKNRSKKEGPELCMYTRHR